LSAEFEDVWRREAPHVVTALVRRYGHFDDAEDATQEALLAAATQWPRDGLPSDLRAWLVRVASRRLIDQWRSDDARRRREGTEARLAQANPPAETPESDDSLWLLVLCCHPVLTKASRVERGDSTSPRPSTNVRIPLPLLIVRPTTGGGQIDGGEVS
jgi:predicted RNA polymerase sigma factor